MKDSAFRICFTTLLIIFSQLLTKLLEQVINKSTCTKHCMTFPSSRLKSHSHSVSIFQTGSGSRGTLGFDLTLQGSRRMGSQVLSLLPAPSTSSLDCHQSLCPLQLRQLHKHKGLFSISEVLMPASSHLLLPWLLQMELQGYLHDTTLLKPAPRSQGSVSSSIFLTIY